MAVIQSDIALPAPTTTGWRQRVWRYIRRHPTMIVGGVLLLIMLVTIVSLVIAILRRGEERRSRSSATRG